MSGWKTLIFGMLVTVFGQLEAFDWTSVLGDSDKAGWITSGIGIIIMVLRAVTTTPIMQSK